MDGAPVTSLQTGPLNGLVCACYWEKHCQAFDTAALVPEVVRIERIQTLQGGILQFDELNPMTGKLPRKPKCPRFDCGHIEYDRTNAPASLPTMMRSSSRITRR